MTDCYLGEIRLFAGFYAPNDWAICDGRTLPISQYQALFSLIGYTYGGMGNSFAIPDFRGRVPISSGTGAGLTARVLAQTGGTEGVELSLAQTPAHTHSFVVSTATTGSTSQPTNKTFVGVPTSTQPLPVCYLPDAPSGLTPQPLNTAVVTSTGNGSAHTNMQPFLVVNYIIALNGLFPDPA